jgi:hypothetical protein
MLNQNARAPIDSIRNDAAQTGTGAPLKSTLPIGLWRAGGVQITMTAQ